MDTYPVYVDVRSANDAFVGVVTVGLNTSPSWYSDGSLVKVNDKYYPANITQDSERWRYYDYDNNQLHVWDVPDQVWKSSTPVGSSSVFDQVPSSFIDYLDTGNFTLRQG